MLEAHGTSVDRHKYFGPTFINKNMLSFNSINNVKCKKLFKLIINISKFVEVI